MEDFGFGSVFSEKTGDGISFNRLKRKNLPASPVFENLKDPEFSSESLKERTDCYCPLFKDLGDPVFPSGDLKSKFLFIGFQPSDIDIENGNYLFDESEEGLLFDAMLGVLLLERRNVVVSPLLYCRSEQELVPPQCIFACSRFLKVLVSNMPNLEYVFTMGTRPFEIFTGIFGNNVLDYVGAYIPYILRGKEIKIIPLNNPNYCVFSERARKENFEILEKIKN